MTTIAYKDGILAADTQVNADNTRLPTRSKKVWKFKDGRLYAGSGVSSAIGRLRKILEAHHAGPLPTPKLDVEALLIMPNGEIWNFENGAWDRENTPYTALGSGFQFALTAMWLGYDAVKAVEAGIQFDNKSGGSVQTVKLDKIPTRRRSRK